jgi:hypothetical protein
LSGAHYGLAFLLLKRGDATGAEEHLTSFLAHAPRSSEAERWVNHARVALEQLRSGTSATPLGESE